MRLANKGSFRSGTVDRSATLLCALFCSLFLMVLAACSGEAPGEPSSNLKPSETTDGNITEPVVAEPAPPDASAEIITRFPTFDAPSQAIAGSTIDLVIALTREQLTPEVSIDAGPAGSVSDEGALEMELPAERDAWQIDVDILAAGFDVADDGGWIRTITLYRDGDSDFARLSLRARQIGEERRESRLIARFNHEGEFLGSATRQITIFRDAGVLAAASAEPSTATESVAATTLQMGDPAKVADLSVVLHYDDPVRLGRGVAYFHSPHFFPVAEAIDTSADLPRWLEAEYARLVALGLRLRGAESLATSNSAPVDPKFVAAAAAGLGDTLYDTHVPARFREAYWLLKQNDLLSSIQITSNSAVLPWELVRPADPQTGERSDFLGISHRVARWAPRETGNQLDIPQPSFPFDSVTTLAPAYEGRAFLPFQQQEIDALSRLPGHRRLEGTFSSLLALIEDGSSGFVHFSGHGEVNDPGSGSPVFGIRLSDEVLDPATWSALTGSSARRGDRFYFFNACDTGRSTSLGGFVQGWGPAMLNAGAAGFIGGMWPLADVAAAEFSVAFYEILAEAGDDPVMIAEALRQVRARFHENGDPTFLAYTFYGNANLAVSGP